MNERGYYGRFGGAFIPEILVAKMACGEFDGFAGTDQHRGL